MKKLNLPWLGALCAISLTLNACGLEDDVRDAAVEDELVSQADEANELIIDEVIDLDAPASLKVAAPWDGAQAHTEATGVPHVPVWTALGLMQIPYQEIDGQVVIGGHTTLGSVEAIAERRERGLGLTSVWFPDGEIDWFHSNLSTNARNNVRAAMDFLNTHTPLEMTEGTSSTSSRMLEFRGNSSSLYGGYAAGYWNEDKNDPIIRLSNNSGTPSSGTVLHETGHALGFPHEFQRPDRDSFVSISGCSTLTPDYAWNYGRMGTWPNWNNEDFELLSPFDKTSVMQYSCVTNLNGTSLPSPSFHDGSATRTQSMSEHDINNIYRVYGKALGVLGDGDSFGIATGTGDFDGDGFEDIVVLTREYYSSTYDRVYLNFYRGVVTDGSEGGAGRKYMPWFRHMFGTTTDRNLEPAVATGDFNGDGIDDLAVGDPSYVSSTSFLNVKGRVGVFTINEPDRFASNPTNMRATWGAKGIQSTRWIYPTTVGLEEASDHGFGSALTTGRFTSTLRDDLIIGAPSARVTTSGPVSTLIIRSGGAVAHVKNLHLTTLSAAITWNPEASLGNFNNKYGSFGASLTTIPSMCSYYSNRYDTFVVGAPNYDASRGAIHVYGCTTGSSFSAPTMLNRIIHSEVGDRYGASIVGFTTGSTTNPTGFYVATGAPMHDTDGFTNLGRVYLDSFDASGNKTYIRSLTPSTSRRVNGFKFGSTLAVHQLPMDSTDDKDKVRIAVGGPGAQSSGDAMGQVFVWSPWVNGAVSGGSFVLSPATIEDGAKFGASISTLRQRKDNGGFVIGAPQLSMLKVSPGIPPTINSVNSGRVEVRLSTAGEAAWSDTRQTLHEETSGDRRPVN